MGRKSCFLALCSYCECYRGADPYAVTPRSDRSGPRETDPASCRIGLRASPSRPRAPDPGGRPERRRGIVLDAELDGLGDDLAARNRPGLTNISTESYPPKRRRRRIVLPAARAAQRSARELGSGTAAPNSISGMLKLPSAVFVLENVAVVKGVVEIKPSNTNVEVS